MATCAVCHEPVELPIQNVNGQLVCQPSTLYFRVTREQRVDAYIQAMLDHGLVVKRDTPRPRGEPLLPCGFGATPTSGAAWADLQSETEALDGDQVL